MSNQIDHKMRDVPDTNVGDTIYRQDAIDAISAKANEWETNGVIPQCQGLRTAVPILESLPPAQPQRMHGRWMYSGDNKWCCSECGCVIKGSWKHPLERMNYYCKECGADMREESNESD